MFKKHLLRLFALTLTLVLLMTSSGLALTLRYPQQSTAVANMQRALAELGYYKSTIDGKFGTGTRTAVRTFQAANKLTVDGVAGPATLAKLEAMTGIDIDGSGTSSGGSTVTGKGLFGGVYTTLQSGDVGSRVRTLQAALKALGFSIGTVDGDFGASTLSAVKAFQKATGLTADGKAGKKTLQKLETYFDKDGNLISGPIVTTPPADEEDTPDYAIPTRTLRFGMSGEDVRYTQQRLSALGYYNNGLDGQFGNGVLKAVKAFQNNNGLTADGVLGPASLKVLFSASAIPADGSATPTPTPTPTPAPDNTLEWGDSGEAVRQLQVRLKELGYYSSSIDGQYGSGTYAAIYSFQQRNGLAATGKADTATLIRLYSDDAIGAEDSSAPTPTPTPTPLPQITPSRTLRYGTTGEDVKLLQNRLIELGYLKTMADGNFGAGTLNALKAFQKANGLSVDGVAGSQTYKKLFSDKAIEADPSEGGEVLIPSRTLTTGDSGDDVRSVQYRLKTLGYLTGTADGQYGTATAAAMKAFQQMNGLTASGDGNMATYAKLFSDGAFTAEGVKEGAASPGYTTLKLGYTGTAVIRLQQALAKYDYKVSVTGTYDDATYQAVQSFQAINGLSVDGVAGKNTQTKLYSGNCQSFPTGGGSKIYGSMGYVAEPAKSQIKLLHWANEIKSTLSYGQALLCYDPATDISWSLTIIARGRHCDVEPSTKADTAAMHAAFGNVVTWTPKPVYVRLPSGVWTVATTHNVAHGINPIPNNDFEGQNCVHFLRDMSETEKNDPNYGVTNQKALRSFWYSLTGENIPYR
ncbi:MAG: peptidoglycan-binding protein [Clostridia bacterium]|nr:peptidoglycan-binding protein [Clostridia bacterium]